MIVEEACWERGCACYDFRVDKGVEVARKEWVGLTNDEAADFVLFHAVVDEECIRAIEAKLKEKNT